MIRRCVLEVVIDEALWTLIKAGGFWKRSNDMAKEIWCIEDLRVGLTGPVVVQIHKYSSLSLLSNVHGISLDPVLAHCFRGCLG